MCEGTTLQTCWRERARGSLTCSTRRASFLVRATPTSPLCCTAHTPGTSAWLCPESRSSGTTERSPTTKDSSSGTLLELSVTKRYVDSCLLHQLHSTLSGVQCCMRRTRGMARLQVQSNPLITVPHHVHRCTVNFCMYSMLE